MLWQCRCPQRSGVCRPSCLSGCGDRWCAVDKHSKTRSRLGLHTVAEGVERDSQLAALSAFGCDTAQGYLWAAAVPDDEFTSQLARTRWSAVPAAIV